MKSLATLLLPLLFPITAFTADNLPVVDHVDLTRYQGKWFEIASIPQSFQKQCVSNVTAEYEILPSEEVKVLNSCETEKGDRSEKEGRAKVVDTETNAKLKVTFVKVAGKWVYLFGGKYWVIKLEENYQYAVVGHPSRDYGWILARNPSLPEATLDELRVFLKDRGYDVCKFMITVQDGGNSEKKKLCKE